MTGTPAWALIRRKPGEVAVPDAGKRFDVREVVERLGEAVGADLEGPVELGLLGTVSSSKRDGSTIAAAPASIELAARSPARR